MDVFSKSQGPPSIEGGQKGLLIFEVDGFDGGVLDGQALGEAGEEVLETNHIGSHRLLSGGLGVLEHATVKEVSEVAVILVGVPQVVGEHGHAPGATFGGGGHDLDRGVEGSSENLLSHLRSGEDAAVAHAPAWSSRPCRS